jgi:hypothetical protein
LRILADQTEVGQNLRLPIADWRLPIGLKPKDPIENRQLEIGNVIGRCDVLIDGNGETA